MPVVKPLLWISRRTWIVVALCAAAGAGCSSSKKKSRSAKRGGNRPKGPKTMGNLLVDSYIADLQKGPLDKKLSAARELGNMGAGAKDALPALGALAQDGDAKIREAVQRAIKAIKK